MSIKARLKDLKTRSQLLKHASAISDMPSWIKHNAASMIGMALGIAGSGYLGSSLAKEYVPTKNLKNNKLVKSFIEKNLQAEEINFEDNYTKGDSMESNIENVANHYVEALPDKSSIVTHARDKSMMLHELGHIANFNKDIRLKAIIAKNLAPLVGLASSTFAAASPTTRKFAPLLIAAGHAPMLTDEARASLKAVAHIKEHGTEEEYATARKRLLLAYGTYILPALGQLIGSAAAVKLLK